MIPNTMEQQRLLKGGQVQTHKRKLHSSLQKCKIIQERYTRCHQEPSTLVKAGTGQCNLKKHLLLKDKFNEEVCQLRKNEISLSPRHKMPSKL